MARPLLSPCATCSMSFSPSACEAYFLPSECGECRRRKAPPTRGFTHEKSLWVVDEALARLWVLEDNGGLLPEDVHAGSNTKFTFRCRDCDAKYSSTPSNKVRAKSLNCYDCGYRRVGKTNSKPKGKTVADVPELMAIWDHEKNEASPTAFAYQSNKKAWWICSEGHSTSATVANRFKGRGCRICQEQLFVSKGEKEVLAYSKEIYPGEVLNNVKRFNYPYETDIYLPALSLGIDYNGIYWHSDEVIMAKKTMDAATWHRLRLANAQASGGRLCYLWEDDWTKDKLAAEKALRALIEEGSVDPMLTRLSR